MIERLVSPEELDAPALENVLRPKALSDYVGQESIKGNLVIAVKAARSRGEALDHILLHGAPGLGKTTLASIIANEFGVSIKITSGPALEKQGDVAAILSNLQENDVLFIDEIHRLKPIVEEVLYSAMEDFSIDLVVGKGPSARIMKLSLPRFTLIGATTKMSMISSPLRDRFGSVFKFQFYTEAEIASVLLRSASILGCSLDINSAELIARSSRFTPRIANRLLKRVRDYAQVKAGGKISVAVVNEALNFLGIDYLGLDELDRKILEGLILNFAGGPVGLSTIAVAIAEDQDTIEDIYEPFLIQAGMLERTKRGRVVTPRAYNHLGIPLPVD